jgi:hypothetical protein
MDVLERFIKWMKERDNGAYSHLKMLRYMDGEPYFASQGAEISLSTFIKNEEKLNDK